MLLPFMNVKEENCYYHLLKSLLIFCWTYL